MIEELNQEKCWQSQRFNLSKKETKLGDVELYYAILKDGRSIKHYRDYKKEHHLDEFGRKLNGRISTNGLKMMSGKVSKTSGKRLSAKASISRISKNGEELRKN